MNRVLEKNKNDWELYSPEYMRSRQSDEELNALVKDPYKAFERMAWKQVEKYYPIINGRKICVPSSGDNHAVFSFALLGAEVYSCDISENQLAASECSAKKIGVSDRIKFVCTDTMTLDNIPDGYFDLVYTSNGVYVWLNDLDAMFRSVHRVLKNGGVYIGCDVHPFLRPFDDGTKIVKTYDDVGPIEDEWHINFHWRIHDILNAIINSGLSLKYIDEIIPDNNIVLKPYHSNQAIEEENSISPANALPKWICAVGQKQH